MNDKPDADLDALAAEVKNLREDFGRVGKVLEELVRHRGSAAATEATRRAERAWDEVNRKAENATQTLEQNPLATLAGAFGLGMVLGMLFSGRR
jgi:ElaB/YqjD/DUF883 family membrane-anchored ribosome-binding protein